MNTSPRNRRKNALMAGSTASSPFDDWTTQHPFYDAVLQWLMDRLESFSDPAVFVILGPTGVGKSTMIRQLENILIRKMKKAMADDPSLIPFVTSESAFTPGIGYDWRTLFEGMLVSGNEFLIDLKVENATEQPGRNLRGLQRAVNNMLLYRAPAVAIIDEGSAFLEKGSKGGLDRNINFLKSLGNRSKTHLALFGDYGLADLKRLSGQLNRRCYFAHLPPYPVEMNGDFRDVVKKFEKRAESFGVNCELTSSTKELFAGSCGCVGLLHRWLNEAFVEARNQKILLGKKVLSETAPSEEDLALWRTEISDGAAKMKKISDRATRIFEP